MFDAPNIMRLAQDLARHAGARQTQTARNIANADTPGFRARDVLDFDDAFRDDQSKSLRATRESHLISRKSESDWRVIDSGGQASPNGNTVSLENEMARSAAAKSQHELAITIYRSSMDLLKTSLGRGR